MRRASGTAVTVGIVALCATLAFAQTGKGVQATAAKAARAMALSGTISVYNARANTLTIKAGSGEQTVYLGAHTRVHEGSKTLKVSELSNLTGHSVKVRYSESGGRMMADTVTVGPPAAK